MLIDKDLDDKIKLIRAERYSLQSVSKKALPQERVSCCLRYTQTHSNVEVWQHLKTDKVFYNNLQTCGSVWHCPVCASKISERRRLELKRAFDMYKADGGYIAFLTLTFSHKKHDRLQDILDKFTLASRRLKSGRWYQDIKSFMQIDGSIKALEITHSELNGFHPHSHEVIFYKNDVDRDRLEDEFFNRWKKCCNKLGLKVSRRHGLTLQDGQAANDYLSKFGEGNWSLDREMSKGHIKKGRSESSMTPFDFLKFYWMTEEEKYLKLFQEYAIVFKGKRQLVWSNGLKAMFAIGEKTDEELSKEKMENADLLGMISFEDWQLILQYEDRAKLLEKVEKFGFELGLKLIMNRLKKIKGDTTEGCHQLTQL